MKINYKPNKNIKEIQQFDNVIKKFNKQFRFSFLKYFYIEYNLFVFEAFVCFEVVT